MQKTVEALKASEDFIQIKSMEVLQRPMSIQTKTLMSIDFNDESGCEPAEDGSTKKLAPVKKDANKFRTLCTTQTIQGHTGYLTFSTFVPAADKSS